MSNQRKRTELVAVEGELDAFSALEAGNDVVLALAQARQAMFERLVHNITRLLQCKQP